MTMISRVPIFYRDGSYVLFVHVPKTGGTSVTSYFAERGWEVSLFDTSDPESPGARNFPRRISPQHLHASVVREIVRPERLDWSFIVVRHPRDRLLSEYRFRRGLSDSPEADFKSFPGWWQDAKASYADDSSAFDNHLRPQVDFLVPGLEVLKLEGGFGRIQEVEMSLRANKGAPEEREEVAFPLLNRSSGSLPEETVSPEIEQEIERFYRADFETFGYPVGRYRSTGSRQRLLAGLCSVGGRWNSLRNLRSPGLND